MKKLFVTGIGTDVGKTLASAILVEAMEADYWKPVQAGNLDQSDSDTVRNLISNSKTVVQPETYRLHLPASPHAAAADERVVIDPSRFVFPETQNNLVIEGGGGVMVPLNQTYLFIDLLESWHIATVIVSRNYLGSINHTLLTVEALQKRNIPILGIIFNGDPKPTSEELILRNTRLRRFPPIFTETKVSKAVVRHYAVKFRKALEEFGFMK
jgi:dethiobiotin synthetase